jgi:hypothetical protein
MGELLCSVVAKLNALPNSSNPYMSPRMIFTRTKLDLTNNYNKDKQSFTILPFGSIVMVKDANPIKSAIAPRAG